MIINRDKTRSIRKVFGQTLANMGEINKDIVVLDADLACSTQTQIFKEKFPERFFDCGIAEQNMIATAAGLASEGKIPFAASFAIFATGRAFDQIRNGVCYPNFDVKIVGTHGGITVGEDGATHQALEDISLMRTIPNMTVLVPSDCKECEEIIKYAATHKGPMYIRIPRSNVVDIFDDTYEFKINKAITVKIGKDMTIITNGETLSECLLAADKLSEFGIDAEIINIPVVKPIDIETVINSAKKTNLVITVENHSIRGGLGSAVCETLSKYYPTKVFRMGTHDEFGQSGKIPELLKYYGLDNSSIAQKAVKIYKDNK